MSVKTIQCWSDQQRFPLPSSFIFSAAFFCHVSCISSTSATGSRLWATAAASSIRFTWQTGEQDALENRVRRRKKTTTPNKSVCVCVREKRLPLLLSVWGSLVCEKQTRSLVVISGACWSQKHKVNKISFFFSVEMLLKCLLIQSELRSDARRSWRMFAGGQRVRKSGEDLQLVNFLRVYMLKSWLVCSNGNSGVLSSVKFWFSPPELKGSFTLQANSKIHCGRFTSIFKKCNKLWSFWEKL